jgi:hypothetical protein
MKNFKQQIKDLLEKEGLKCTIEETDSGLLVVEKKGRFRQGLHGYYWYVADQGTITKKREAFEREDDNRYVKHNYFETFEEAIVSHKNQLKLGQFLDYILELRDQGFRVEFQATDIEVATRIGEKFGAVSLF